jgi:hypothetical protein
VNARPTLAAAVLLGCGVLLTACASDGGYAYDLRPSDIAGTWTAAGDLDAVLTFDADGSVIATSWPRTVMCSAEVAEQTSELDDAATVDFEGTWKLHAGAPGGSLPDVQLNVPADVCPEDSPQGFLWRGSDDRVSLCFPLGTSDPDSFQTNRMLVLQSGHQGPLRGPERTGGHR